MRNRVLSIAPYLLALLVFALLAATVQPADSATSGDGRPVIRKVSPTKVKIGEQLVIKGSNFRRGKLKNTVIFSRKGAQALFVKADEATETQITITVPAKLAAFLTQKGGKPRATRFQLRVLSKTLSKSPTSRANSPVVSPNTETPGGGGGDGGTPTPPADCDKDGTPNDREVDDDNDVLTDELELRAKTDTCKADSDGDTIEDGYEYYSAIDLNRVNLPYPGKRPYPNALDGNDAGKDFDGDSLTLLEEFTAWIRYGRHQLPLNYSDGDPRTGQDVRDDERDVDADGLTNYTEAHGPLSDQSWWNTFWKDEKPYKTLPLGTDWLDPDTDGDGLLDGPDDIDFDGYDNAFESSRDDWWTQPFNPCLPDPSVDMCSPYIPDVENAWPPFKEGYTKADQGPLRLPTIAE